MESLLANSPLPPGSSRYDRDPAQFLRGEACHTPAPPGKIRIATLLLRPSSPGHGRFCFECPGGEYGLSPSPTPCRSTPRRMLAPALHSMVIADRSPIPRPP